MKSPTVRIALFLALTNFWLLWYDVHMVVVMWYGEVLPVMHRVGMWTHPMVVGIGVCPMWGHSWPCWRGSCNPTTARHVGWLVLLQNIIISDFLITIIGMSCRGGGVVGATPRGGASHSHRVSPHAPRCGGLLVLLIMHVVSVSSG